MKGVRIVLLLIVMVSFQNTINSQDSIVNLYTDYNDAKVFATANELPILMVFAGSDWCRPCIQFKKEILQDEDFNKYSSSKLVILYLDFPAHKKNKLDEAQTEQNEELAEKYNRLGSFPKIILFNYDEEKLGEIEYKNQSAILFVEECKEITE